MLRRNVLFVKDAVVTGLAVAVAAVAIRDRLGIAPEEQHSGDACRQIADTTVFESILPEVDPFDRTARWDAENPDSHCPARPEHSRHR